MLLFGPETMAIMSAVGTGLSLVQGMSAAKKQEAAAEESRRLAQKNAANIEAETMEQKRREADAQKDVEAQTRARIAASGVTGAGSPKDYLDTMEAEHAKELDWLRKSGASRASIAKSEGNIAYRQGMASASSTMAGTFSNVISGAGTTYGYGTKAGWWS